MYIVIFTIPLISFFFFFNDTATTEIYTLSLHDALPILQQLREGVLFGEATRRSAILPRSDQRSQATRSEEHTSELQSQSNLVCRLLLEKKKQTTYLRRLHTPANAQQERAPPRAESTAAA